jgi:hypothetical protein
MLTFLMYKSHFPIVLPDYPVFYFVCIAIIFLLNWYMPCQPCHGHRDVQLPGILHKIAMDDSAVNPKIRYTSAVHVSLLLITSSSQLPGGLSPAIFQGWTWSLQVVFPSCLFAARDLDSLILLKLSF